VHFGLWEVALSNYGLTTVRLQWSLFLRGFLRLNNAAYGQFWTAIAELLAFNDEYGLVKEAENE
jgi:hypothetical protein